MDKSIFVRHEKRVNKAITIIMNVCLLFCVGLNINGLIKGEVLLWFQIMILVITSLTVVVLQVLRKGKHIISYILIIGSWCFAESVIYFGATSSMGIVPIVMASMLPVVYFKKQFTMVFGICTSLLFLLLGICSHSYTSFDLINATVFYVLSVTMYYFIARWGHEFVISSNNEKENAYKLLNELQDTLVAIKNNTNNVNNDIESCSSLMSNLKYSTDEILNVVNSVAQGIGEQVTGISGIGNMMKDADKKVEDAANMAKDVFNISLSSRTILSKVNGKPCVYFRTALFMR